MRGILIDPFAKTITEVALSDGGLNGIREAIGDCFVECVRLGLGVDLWIDEEGMLDAQEAQAYFGLVDVHGNVKPLAGKGIVLGTDREGETIACPASVSVGSLSKIVRWFGDCWSLEDAIKAGKVARPMSCFHRAVGPDMEPIGECEILWQWEAPPKPEEPEAGAEGAAPKAEG